MKRFILVAALLLGGCSTFNPFASFTNPISNDTLVKAEAAYGAALSVALGYRNACDKREIPTSCRPIVVQIQNANSYAIAQIHVARSFVKNNPTLDATAVITTAKNAVDAFAAVANAKGTP